jgi:hypothetical protein
MLRHSGKGVRVGGAAPSLQILVLEDGDEIVIGRDRAVFQILKLPPLDEGTSVFREPS